MDGVNNNKYAGSIAQTTPVWKNEYNEVVPKPKDYKDNTTLDMADFYMLMAAQMQYQDVLNPESNTSEMMTQMVQMSMVNAIQDMMTMSTTTYAASMMGKTVTIAETVNGKLNTIEGVVEGVTLYDGDPKIIVNGKEYSMNQIMQLGTMTKTEDKDDPDDPENPPTDGDGNGSNPPVDGDGNGSNPPVDGDGNGSNPPVDGDGNGSNPPVDGDGNGSNPPVDGDGNGSNPPTDGSGSENDNGEQA